MKPTVPENSRRAFTLVELLTVIAILGILVALIFPVVGKSKDKAGNVECMNNLRSIHAAYMLDTQDHDMQIPRSYNDQSRGADSYSNTWIEDYYQKLGGVWQEVNGGKSTAKIAGCPVQRRQKKRGPYQRTFSINTTLTDNDIVTSFSAAPRLQSFRYPAQTALLADGAVKANGSSYGAFNNSSQPAFRPHGDRSNILFLDGHIEAWTASQWASVKTIPAGGDKPGTIFWKGY